MNNFRVIEKNKLYFPQERFLFMWLTIYSDPFNTLEEAESMLQEHIQRITPNHNL
jgi:hypothetical protein